MSMPASAATSRSSPAREFRATPALTPIGPGNRLMHEFMQESLRTAFRVLWKMRLADVRPLPPGPVIVAANHRSYLDPLVFGAVLDRRVFYIMARKYYRLPVINHFYRLERCIAVDDERDNRAALRAGKSILDAGRVLGIFPEGGISKTGELQPGQPGVAWMAARTGAPVFPMYISGTREALLKGTWRLRLGSIQVHMGEPLFTSQFPVGRRGQDAFTAALMDSIGALAPS